VTQDRVVRQCLRRGGVSAIDTWSNAYLVDCGSGHLHVPWLVSIVVQCQRIQGVWKPNSSPRYQFNIVFSGQI
jgi:hypothetical protein